MTCRTCEKIRGALGIGGWRKPAPKQPPPYGSQPTPPSPPRKPER